VAVIFLVFILCGVLLHFLANKPRLNASDLGNSSFHGTGKLFIIFALVECVCTNRFAVTIDLPYYWSETQIFIRRFIKRFDYLTQLQGMRPYHNGWPKCIFLKKINESYIWITATESRS